MGRFGQGVCPTNFICKFNPNKTEQAFLFYHIQPGLHSRELRTAAKHVEKSLLVDVHYLTRVPTREGRRGEGYKSQTVETKRRRESQPQMAAKKGGPNKGQCWDVSAIRTASCSIDPFEPKTQAVSQGDTHPIWGQVKPQTYRRLEPLTP